MKRYEIIHRRRRSESREVIVWFLCESVGGVKRMRGEGSAVARLQTPVSSRLMAPGGVCGLGLTALRSSWLMVSSNKHNSPERISGPKTLNLL